MNAPRQFGSWRAFAYERFVLPWAERASCGDLRARLREWRTLEELSPEAIAEIQWLRLQRLLHHAYEQCPFYRSRFEMAGLHPSRLRAPNDLERLPVLTRDDLRLHYDEMIAANYRGRRLYPAATGGTTYTPVRIVRDEEALRSKIAAQWRWNAWAGYRPGDRILYLWGATSDYAAQPGWRWRLYDSGLMRRRWLPASRLNAAGFEAFRLALNRHRPQAVIAYPTPLALWAESLEAGEKPFHRPNTVICTAEPLLAAQRRLIERVFGCPVQEQYGSRELGIVAGSCRHGQMHLNSLLAHVEYAALEERAAGKLRQLIFTDLVNFALPLIRYRINDCAEGPEPGPCACGASYPRFGPVQGRVGDVFHLPNGDLVPGVTLTNRVLQVCPGLRKTQVVQESLRRFCVRYVPGPEFSPADLGKLQANLAKFFPPDVDWRFEAVGEIPREPSGKTRFCISHVA